MAIPNNSAAVAGEKPNILFIQVDEMRFPMGFPSGIENAGEFLQKVIRGSKLREADFSVAKTGQSGRAQ